MTQEQDPVAWLYRDSWETMKLSQITPPPVGAFPVYTTPPQRTWVGLFDEEIEVLFQTAAGADEEVHIRFARAIESKLKEVNT